MVSQELLKIAFVHFEHVGTSLDLPSYHIIWYMVSFVPENTLSGSNGVFSKKSRFFTLLGGHGWVKILKKYLPLST